jgi:hypothetical protein
MRVFLKALEKAACMLLLFESAFCAAVKTQRWMDVREKETYSRPIVVVTPPRLRAWDRAKSHTATSAAAAE